MKNQNDKTELNEFFIRHLSNKKYIICEECGRRVFSPTRANIAHILPKQIFKSVETNNNNFLYLCLECHGNFDSSWKKAATMFCWSKALVKYNLFKNEVQEYHRILNYFNNEYN